MKAWAVAAAALSLTALCACSSTDDQKAPDSAAPVEDQWKYHVKKSYPQWQAPAEAPAQKTSAQTQTAAPASQQPVEIYAEPPGFIVKDNFGAYPKTEGYSHYIVKKGDSLWTISKTVYRKGDNWKKIYDLNKDVIKDPSKLKPGTDLKIPPP